MPSAKSIKLLWAAAAGTCSFPDCGARLVDSAAGAGSAFTTGEMAHICGERMGSCRHDPVQTAAQRNDHSNLILLCPNHHTLIDRPENAQLYTVANLLEMKAAHENFIRRVTMPAEPTRAKISRQILNYLAENRAVWEQYGPFSNVAKLNPHDEKLFALWQSVRLSVIVPNNRRISEILRINNSVFGSADLPAVALFNLHTRSYESWVNDEIEYAGVARFPESFEEMLKGAC